MGYRRESQTAVLVASAVLWLIGAGWYTALGRPWLAATGRTLEQVQHYGVAPYLLALPLCWVTCYGLANVMTFNAEHSPARGVMIGFFLACTVFAPLTAMQVMFAGLSPLLFVVNGGYGLLGMAICGGLIGAMKPGAAR